jgi:hypothetical protein
MSKVMVVVTHKPPHEMADPDTRFPPALLIVRHGAPHAAPIALPVTDTVYADICGLALKKKRKATPRRRNKSFLLTMLELRVPPAVAAAIDGKYHTNRSLAKALEQSSAPHKMLAAELECVSPKYSAKVATMMGFTV